MLDLALDICDASAGVALVPGAIELLGGRSKLYDQIAGQVLLLGLSALLAPQLDQGRVVLPIMIRASEPPMNARRSAGVLHKLDFMDFSILEMTCAVRRPNQFPWDHLFGSHDTICVIRCRSLVNNEAEA